MQKELEYIKRFLEKSLENNNKEVIYLCIGSSEIIGDSIGPRVGSLLKKQSRLRNIKIFGEVQNSVTAKNISQIKKELIDKYIIVIDSAMGRKELIEKIYISNIKTKLGNSLNKNIEKIGDISIKACVCEDLQDPIKNYYELRKVDKKLIANLTNQIVDVICKVNE